MFQRRRFRCFPFSARRMIKFRGRFRLLLGRVLHLRTASKLITVFSIIMFIVMYLQEKHEKDAMIDLALGNKMRNSEELVKPDSDTVILNGLAISSGDEDKHKIQNAFVVIAVTSSPENLHRRNIIRNTWAKRAKDHGTIVLFFLGKPAMHSLMSNLIHEAHHYQDLVIDDFHESYYGLTIKTLRVLKYFKFHHSKSKFLVKTDDDVFVNVPNLVHYCYFINKRFDTGGNAEDGQERKAQDYFIGGVIHTGRKPHTWNPFSKWYAPLDVWRAVVERALEEPWKISGGERSGLEEEVRAIDEDRYPPYAEGNFYILSSEAAHSILNVSKIMPLYHLEDVHVTGVLATWMLKIEKENVPYISSSSNVFPYLNYFWHKMFTASPKDFIAYHCDNYVELITIIESETTRL